MKAGDYRYLIIGGAPKAGTTSLFHWLNDHPDAKGALFKEARFFLDADYPLDAPVKYNGNNLEHYLACFEGAGKEDKLMVEATPDYLYSKTALQISSLLPKAKMIFILRDPVERTVSWYKYARQRGQISMDISFEAYVMAQVDQPIKVSTPTYMRALEQNKYDNYLKGFKETLGDRLMVVDFKQLKFEPRNIMHDVCKFICLDNSFYKDYDFTVKNASPLVANPTIGEWYSQVRNKVVYALCKFPRLIQWMKYPNSLLKRVFLGKSVPAQEVVVSEKIEIIIRLHANDCLEEELKRG